MEHCYKILCLVTAMVVFVGALVSCTRPLRACAVEITAEEQAGINDFLDLYAENLSGIDFELNSDSDGNRNVRLQILGRQQLAYNELLQIYDNMDFSAAPSSISVSGSGCTGLYQSSVDNDIHAVSLLSGGNSISSPVASSDEFVLRFAVDADKDVSGRVDSSFSGTNVNYSFLFTYPDSTTYTVTFPNSSYFTSGYSSTATGRWSSTIGFSLRLGFASGIPVISPNLAWSNYVGKTLRLSIGGEGVSIALPESSVDSDTPWDYYNDVLLPELKVDFPGYDDYFVFPDGYNPDEQPTEPNYQTTNNVYVIPIIIGDPLPVDITDDLGNILEVLDILADLLPDGGLQIQIDGITLSFPRDGDSVVVDGTKYPLPLPDFQIDGHTINLPDNLHFDFDGIPFVINSDGTITINDDTYSLPIGIPMQLSTEYDNYVYQYEIPTMERINVVDSTLSPVDLSSFADGVSGFYGLAARLYYDLGLFNPLIICLSVAAVGYAISKIGGGH